MYVYYLLYIIIYSYNYFILYCIIITGIVKVRLAGSCVGCPSSSVTLRNGVENMLMHYIPEVKGIQDMTGVEVPSEEGGESTTSGDMKLSFPPNQVRD